MQHWKEAASNKNMETVVEEEVERFEGRGGRAGYHNKEEEEGQDTIIRKRMITNKSRKCKGQVRKMRGQSKQMTATI